MIQYYELLTLVPGTISEEDTQGIVQLLRETLEKEGAQIHKHEVWEKRKLAYPVDKVRQGIYILSTFHLETTHVAAIERVLRLNTTILRYQFVRAEQKTTKQIEQESRRIQAEAAPAEIRTSSEAPVANISKEELDEKLAEILTDDMVK